MGVAENIFGNSQNESSGFQEAAPSSTNPAARIRGSDAAPKGVGLGFGVRCVKFKIRDLWGKQLSLKSGMYGLSLKPGIYWFSL